MAGKGAAGDSLFSTRWGLALRAVGENPVAAFAAGRNPRVLQYQALLLAGALGGIAGAQLSIGVAKTWAEWMTAGRGFIAVALVIFARWQPRRAIAGAGSIHSTGHGASVTRRSISSG